MRAGFGKTKRISPNNSPALLSTRSSSLGSNLMPNINLIYYLIAGTIFGFLALKTGIPAAPLAGALIGASILSISGKIETATWPVGTRTLLEIGIGTVIGTSLTKDSLVELYTLWKPAILITFTLVLKFQ